jgi:hypothetical protein
MAAKVRTDETERTRETAGGERPAIAEARDPATDTPDRASSAAPVETSARESGVAVYIGPTIHGKIQKGTVFKGGMREATELYAAAIEQYPAIVRLIVSGERLAAARNDINMKRGLAYKHYKELVNPAQGL